MLGDLKDKYGDLLSENPSWYINKFIAFGPKMYQLILKDSKTGKIICWDKTMKGISMKGNSNLFSMESLPLYRNPVLDFCSILQYDSEDVFCTLSDVRSMMIHLENSRKGVVGKRSKSKDHLSISLRFNQSLFNSFSTRLIFLNDPLFDEWDPTQWVPVSRKLILHFLKNRVSTTKCLFSCL